MHGSYHLAISSLWLTIDLVNPRDQSAFPWLKFEWNSSPQGLRRVHKAYEECLKWRKLIWSKRNILHACDSPFDALSYLILSHNQQIPLDHYSPGLAHVSLTGERAFEKTSWSFRVQPNKSKCLPSRMHKLSGRLEKARDHEKRRETVSIFAFLNGHCVIFVWSFVVFADLEIAPTWSFPSLFLPHLNEY